MRLNKKLALITFAAVVLFTGCIGQPRTVNSSNNTNQQPARNPELIAQQSPPIPDLPVPYGFRLDEGVSSDFALASARLVVHTYRGKAEKLSVKKFYERYMPMNRWTLTTAMFIEGDVMLDFEKENERCKI